MDDARLLRITSPLGEGALIPIKLSAVEELGMTYRFDVDVLGRDPGLVPSDLLKKEVTVKVVRAYDGQPVERFYHGIVCEFQRLGPGAARRMTYRLSLAPGLFRLGLKRNCRIFQEKSARDIVDAILSEHELPAAIWGIVPDLQPIPYCTQFNETDLHFVSRLLEEYGMTYYFTHSATGHKLCISATAQGFPTFAGGQVNAMHASPRFFDFSGWQRDNNVRSAKTSYEDMDEERSQPSVVLKKKSDTRTYAGEPSMWGPGESPSMGPKPP